MQSKARNTYANGKLLVNTMKGAENSVISDEDDGLHPMKRSRLHADKDGDTVVSASYGSGGDGHFHFHRNLNSDRMKIGLAIVCKYWFNRVDISWNFDRLEEPQPEKSAKPTDTTTTIPILLTTWQLPRLLNKPWSQWISDIQCLRERVITYLADPPDNAVLKIPDNYLELLNDAQRSAHQGHACWKSIHPQHATNLSPAMWILRQELLQLHFAVVASTCRQLNHILIQDEIFITPKLISEKQKLLKDRNEHYTLVSNLAKDALTDKIKAMKEFVEESVNRCFNTKQSSSLLADSLCHQNHALLGYYLNKERPCIFQEIDSVLTFTKSLYYKHHFDIVSFMANATLQQELFDPSNYKDGNAHHRWISNRTSIVQMRNIFLVPLYPWLEEDEVEENVGGDDDHGGHGDDKEHEEDQTQPQKDENIVDRYARSIMYDEYRWKHFQSLYAHRETIPLVFLKKTKGGKAIPPPCLQADDIRHIIQNKEEYALFPDRIRSHYFSDSLTWEMETLFWNNFEAESLDKFSKRFRILSESVHQCVVLIQSDSQKEWSRYASGDISDGKLRPLERLLSEEYEWAIPKTEKSLPPRDAVVVRWLVESMRVWIYTTTRNLESHVEERERVLPDYHTEPNKYDWGDGAMTCVFWIHRLFEIAHIQSECYDAMKSFCALYKLKDTLYKEQVDTIFKSLKTLLSNKVSTLIEVAKHVGRACMSASDALCTKERISAECLNGAISDDLPFATLINSMIKSFEEDKVNIAAKMNIMADQCKELWASLVDHAYQTNVHPVVKKALKRPTKPKAPRPPKIPLAREELDKRRKEQMLEIAREVCVTH